MVVEKKKNVNFDIPAELIAEFDRVSGIGGGVKKWMVVSAAILLLLELPEDAQRHMMWKVAESDFGVQTIGGLIEKAKSGELRKDALAAAPVRIAAHNTTATGTLPRPPYPKKPK